MDPEKAALLFGEVPHWADPDDPADRAELLAVDLGDEDDLHSRLTARFREAVSEMLAGHILDEDPPEVWATARRLSAAGLDRVEVLRNLRLALIPSIHAAVGTDSRIDVDQYLRALARLPLPSGQEVEAAMVAEVRAAQPVDIRAVEAGAAARLGIDLEEQPYRALVDRAFDQAVLDGPLEVLPGDLVVEPATFCAGTVMTHRLSELEREMDVLFCTVDLAGFSWVDEPVFDGEPLEPFSVEEGHLAWGGPPGWLERFADGDLLEVRVDAAGSLTIEVLAVEPPLDGGLVEAVRAVYDRAVEQPGLPIRVAELVLGVLGGDRGRLATPQAPLRDVIEAAGLELRGGYVVDDEEIWKRGRDLQRAVRLHEILDDPESVEHTLDVLEAFEDERTDAAGLRRAAAALVDLEVLEAVVHEVVDHLDDADPDRIAAFAARLSDAAHRPSDRAAARLFGGLAIERTGDLDGAEEQLRLAVYADSDCAAAADRLGWYLADRGRAAEAVRVWRAAGFTSKDHPDLRVAESFSRTGSAKIGRNEACWCGSGRKYKVCHLGKAETAPLPERVPWLRRKAVAYLERCGGDASYDLLILAAARAGEDAEDGELVRAMSDQLVIDLALTEGGWFERFCRARSSLLPDDEALLAASWVLVDRTLYEVVDVRPGSRLTVRDLRSAELVEVRERTFSAQAQPGDVVCARAVPDGVSHQFIGSVFPVRAGREAELLDLLDRGDAEEIAAYVGASEAPPVLQTREGEPLVECESLLVCDDPAEATKVLDRLYETEEPGVWTEMHPISDDELILRATLRLDENRLRVQTMSEARMERVLGVLSDEIVGGLRVESSKRRPLSMRDVKSLGAGAGAGGGLGAGLGVGSGGPDVGPEVAEQISHQIESRWCDEPVPALGGVTPRQAASDPSRREALERLLLEFSRMPVPAGAIGMRPERLRSMLGL